MIEAIEELKKAWKEFILTIYKEDKILKWVYDKLGGKLNE